MKKLTLIAPYLITGKVVTPPSKPSEGFVFVTLSIEGKKAPLTVALYDTKNVKEGSKLTTVARAAMGAKNRIVGYPVIDGDSSAEDKASLLVRAQSFPFNPTIGNRS